MSGEDPDPSAPHDEPAGRTVKFLGIEFPAPSWVGYCLGGLVIVGFGAAVYLKVIVPIIEEQAGQLHRVSELNEYQRHLSEVLLHKSTVLEGPELGVLTVGYYASDGCLLITATPPGNQGSLHHFIQKAAYAGPPPGPTLGGRSADNIGTSPEIRPGARNSAREFRDAAPQATNGALTIATVLLANTTAGSSGQGCTGRCTSPHPGPFRSWNGDRNGCWLAIWRQWADGCTHYQWYNTCNGAWDSNPDGSPKVWWTCCVH